MEAQRLAISLREHKVVDALMQDPEAPQLLRLAVTGQTQLLSYLEAHVSQQSLPYVLSSIAHSAARAHGVARHLAPWHPGATHASALPSSSANDGSDGWCTELDVTLIERAAALGSACETADWPTALARSRAINALRAPLLLPGAPSSDLDPMVVQRWVVTRLVVLAASWCAQHPSVHVIPSAGRPPPPSCARSFRADNLFQRSPPPQPPQNPYTLHLPPQFPQLERFQWHQQPTAPAPQQPQQPQKQKRLSQERMRQESRQWHSPQAGVHRQHTKSEAQTQLACEGKQLKQQPKQNRQQYQQKQLEKQKHQRKQQKQQSDGALKPPDHESEHWSTLVSNELPLVQKLVYSVLDGTNEDPVDITLARAAAQVAGIKEHLRHKDE
jgi:hypothetical protein